MSATADSKSQNSGTQAHQEDSMRANCHSLETPIADVSRRPLRRRQEEVVSGCGRSANSPLDSYDKLLSQDCSACVPRRRQALSELRGRQLNAPAMCIVLSLWLAFACAECPSGCNQRGTCEGKFKQFCACEDPWAAAPDCSRRSCLEHPAWFDYPQPDGSAHLPATCAGQGYCDGELGLCECATGFTGAACQRTECPNGCSGHGKCVTMRDYAARQDYRSFRFNSRYEEWDADMNTGCVCDSGWRGFDCSERECVFGDNPLDNGLKEVQSINSQASSRDTIQVIAISADEDIDEIQQIITLVGEQYRLRFDSRSDTPGCRLCSIRASVRADFLDFDATAAVVEDALENTMSPPVIDDVVVTRDAAPGGGYIYNVTFTGLQVGGNLPQLEVDSGNVDEISTIRDGNELDGFVSMFFDDRLSRPPCNFEECFGRLNFSIPYDARGNDVQAAFAGIPSIDEVVAETIFVGGPGFHWRVTFTHTLGDAALLECDPFTLEEGTPEITNPSCNVTRTQPGFFMDGTFRVSYAEEETPPLLWNITSDDMAEAINRLNSTFAGVFVTRRRLIEGEAVINPFRWTGQFRWIITFVNFPFNLFDNLFVRPESIDLFGASDETVIAGTPAEPFSREDVVERHPEEPQINELQLIDCVCPGECQGGVNLTLYGEISDQIFHDSSAEHVRAVLEQFSEVDQVAVEYFGSPGGTLCDADGVTTAITFTHNPGEVPALQVARAPNTFTLTSLDEPDDVRFSILEGNYVFGSQGSMSRKGTRALKECSDRGICDRRTGQCVCFDGWGNSDRAGVNLKVSYGRHRDCGAPTRVITNCPLNCLLTRGTCVRPQHVCECLPPFTGPACQSIQCPSAIAWFDEATGKPGEPFGGAHRVAECGGEGMCQKNIGKCRCNPEFTGVACQQRRCPGKSLARGQGGTEAFPDGCNGHGSCITMAAMANRSRSPDDDRQSFAHLPLVYDGWDKDKNRGCSCDRASYVGKYGQEFKDYFGPDCMRLECPRGADPNNPVGVFERQRMTCSATDGFFTLDFRGSRSVDIPTTLPPFGPEGLEHYLDSISSLRRVTIHPVAFPAPNATVLVGSDEDEVFESSCFRLPDAKDYALRREQDLHQSAECWPIPTICGTTETGLPFQIDITFVSEHGDVPMLKVVENGLVDGDIQFEELQQGTKETVECNGRGACDFRTGRCVCAPQYGSSDGRFAEGDLGDCAHRHAYYGFVTPTPPPPDRGLGRHKGKKK